MQPTRLDLAMSVHRIRHAHKVGGISDEMPTTTADNEQVGNAIPNLPIGDALQQRRPVARLREGIQR